MACLNALLAACASDLVFAGSTLHAAAPAAQRHVSLQSAIRIESSSGYARDLPSGSIWEFRGTIEQGDVYRRVDGILTVEDKQIHEGYLVVAQGRAVGFYLPVEQAYSPAREAVAAELK